MRIDINKFENLLLAAYCSPYVDKELKTFIQDALDEVRAASREGYPEFFIAASGTKQEPTSNIDKKEEKKIPVNEDAIAETIAKEIVNNIFKTLFGDDFFDDDEEESADFSADSAEYSADDESSDINFRLKHLGLDPLYDEEDDDEDYEDEEEYDFDDDFEEDDDEQDAEEDILSAIMNLLIHEHQAEEKETSDEKEKESVLNMKEIVVHVINKGHADDFVGKCPVVFTAATDCEFNVGIAKYYVDKYFPLWRTKKPELPENEMGETPDYGVAYAGNDKDEKFFILMPKKNSRDKLDDEIVAQVLDVLAEKVKKEGITEIAMPRIFCGLDRKDWFQVMDCLEEAFNNHGMTILFRE